MIPSEVIALALQRVNMTETEVGDGTLVTGTSRCYEYLNIVKDQVWAKIVASTTGKDLSWEEWRQDFTISERQWQWNSSKGIR